MSNHSIRSAEKTANAVIVSYRRQIETLEERIRNLEQVLVPPAGAPPLAYGLTASQARVYAHLATRAMGTKDSIMMALYSDRPGLAPDPRIIDQILWQMRRKLEKFGVSIVTVWGQGYRLERPAKALEVVS